MKSLSLAPFPCPSHILVQYILFLYNKGYASSTIQTHLSAINFIHRLANLKQPSDAFVVKKIMIGICKQTQKPDVRLPITIDILRKLMTTLHLVFLDNKYLATMLKAMFSVAFHAFLRVGEISISPTAKHTIEIGQVIPSSSMYKIILKSFKHAISSQCTTIELHRSEEVICPVKHLAAYLEIRPKVGGPLFVFPDGIAISKNFFNCCLRKSLKFIGLSSGNYKSHSFRIGSATHSASLGASDDLIMRMGRWKSNAFLRYIRLPSLNFKHAPSKH